MNKSARNYIFNVVDDNVFMSIVDENGAELQKPTILNCHISDKFHTGMLKKYESNFVITKINKSTFNSIKKYLPSAVDNSQTAKKLGIATKRKLIKLDRGDVLIVAQLKKREDEQTKFFIVEIE